MWRSGLVQVEALATTEQEVHAIVRVRSQTFNWLIRAIYASPRFEERCILWENLKMLANMRDLPWALMGDFNEVLTDEKKSGGNHISQRRVRAIQDCMDTCHMLDLGFSGPKFTWTSKRGVEDLIQCRLDRCWANPTWKAFFDEANVTHLARVNSDHCPLLLKLKPLEREELIRPFRFQLIWLSHSEFPGIVRDAWSGQKVILADAIFVFVSKAKVWNREVFGNVFAKKKRLMARLVGIQKALANRPCTFLINLQNQLSDEYNNILQLEEELWAMKARTNWIINGEQNTSYFHLSTIVRRSKNRITSIQNAYGEWVHDTGEVKRIFMDYFHKLYQFEQVYGLLSPAWDSDWYASLAEEEALDLAQPPIRC